MAQNAVASLFAGTFRYLLGYDLADSAKMMFSALSRLVMLDTVFGASAFSHDDHGALVAVCVAPTDDVRDGFPVERNLR